MQRNKQYLMDVASVPLLISLRYVWTMEMLKCSAREIFSLLSDADGSGPVSNNQNNERLDSKNTSSMHFVMHLKGYFLTWDLVWVHQIASLSYLVTNVHRYICLLWKLSLLYVFASFLKFKSTKQKLCGFLPRSCFSITHFSEKFHSIFPLPDPD